MVNGVTFHHSTTRTEAMSNCEKCGEPAWSSPTGICSRCMDALGRSLWENPDIEASGVLGDFGEDYVLLEKIAQGGMGVIYRARHRQLKREVALKMIRDGRLTSAEMIQRFRLEAETVARLDHPNIVPVHDSGDVGGQFYYSMKLIDGVPLANVSNLRTLATIMAKIADALQYAHERGVLHRDIKTSNILIDRDGEPHLLDFGLVKVVGEDSTLTQTHALMGSPAYMAPEQLEGSVAKITVATDVYGLGAVMYELLTGRPPYTGTTPVETLQRMANETLVLPRKWRPDLDRDLETICLKCLEKSPGQRYATARAVAEDLQRWRKGEPVRARPVGAAGRLWRWGRRNPALAGMAGLSLAALSLGMAGVGWMAQREKAQRILAERHLVAQDMLTVGQALKDHDMGRARERFARPRTHYANRPAPWEIRVIDQLVSDQSDKTLDRHETKITGLGFLNDRRLIAGSLDGLVTLWGGGQWELERSFRPTTSLDTLFTAAKAPAFAVLDDKSKRMRIFRQSDLHETHTIPVTMDNQYQGRMAALFPDGRRLLYTSPERNLQLADLGTPDAPVVSLTKAPMRMSSSTAVSDDARMIAAFAPESSPFESAVMIMEVSANGEWPSQWERIEINHTQPEPKTFRLSFSPNTRHLAAVVGSEVFLIDAIARRLVSESALRHPSGHQIEAVAFSSGGERLYTGGTDQTLRVHEVEAWQSLDALSGHRSTIMQIVADSGAIITGALDGEVKVWTSQETNPFPQHPKRCKERFFASLTHHYYTVEERTRVCRRELATSEIIHELDFEKWVVDVLPLDKSGRLAVLLDDTGERQIEIWDGVRGDRLHSLSAFAEPMHLRIGPEFDYRFMSYLEETNEIVCFANAAGQLPWDLPKGPITLHRFDLRSGECVSSIPLELGLGISTGAFDHSGRWHVWGGHDGNLLVIDVRSGEIVARPNERHYSYVSQISFSADGQTMVSVSERRVLLWDTQTWKKSGEITSSGEEFYSVAIHPREPRLAVGGSNLSVTIWDLIHHRQAGALAPMVFDGSSLFKLQFCGPQGDTLAGWANRGTWLKESARVVMWRP